MEIESEGCLNEKKTEDILLRLVNDLEFLQYEHSIDEVKPSRFDFCSDATCSVPNELSGFGLNLVKNFLHIGLVNEAAGPDHSNHILLLVWPSFVSPLAYGGVKNHLPGIKKIKTLIFRVPEVIFQKYGSCNISLNEVIAASAILAPFEEWKLLERLIMSAFYSLIFDKSTSTSYGNSDIWENYPQNTPDSAWKQLLFICCGPQSIAYVVKKMMKRNWDRLLKMSERENIDNEKSEYLVFFQGDTISLLIQWSKFLFKHDSLLSCLNEINSTEPILDPTNIIEMIKNNFAATVAQSKTFRCRICGYQSDLREHYVIHSRTHTGEKPFACTLCQKSFSDRSTLRMHNIIHNRSFHSSCKFCGKEFGKPFYLKVHIANSHSPESHYQCFRCHSFFKNEADLASHMPSHANDLKFECSSCPRRFDVKSRLNEHLRTHSKDKPFKCDICKTGFLRRPDLRRHTAQHSGSQFECSVCKKSFKRNDHRLTHERVMHMDV